MAERAARSGQDPAVKVCGRIVTAGHGYRIPCANVKPCPDHPERRLGANGRVLR